MSERLPPLTALRAFDAAARHMSFAKAAEELNVTPAALSFQIKSLETHLGAPVFHRLNRAIDLTEAGHALADGVADGFQTLNAAWRAALRTLEEDALTVTAGPAFTAKWLAPRLFEFAQVHPEIDLRFAASLKRLDLTRDGIDVAIRFSHDVSEPGLWYEPLAAEWVTPVMSPEFATRFGTLETLASAPLVHDESISFLKPYIDWPTWFDFVGIAADTSHGPRFSNSDHALDAALAGSGIALGRRSLVVKDIAEGRLVAPFPFAINTGGQFHFLCTEQTKDRPSIVAFRDWIISEIKKTSFVTEAMRIFEPDTDPEEVAAYLATLDVSVG